MTAQLNTVWESPCSFQIPDGVRLPSKEKRMGPPTGPVFPAVELNEDGGFTLRMLATGAQKVTVGTGFMSVYKFEAELKDRGDGLFECTVPGNENLRGLINLNFNVDGVGVVHPNLPAHIIGRHLANYVELPDWETPYAAVRDVPHGTLMQEIFWSDTVQSWERCFIYAPPGYLTGSGSYPVLYLQHGAGENETGWPFSGRLPYIMDNLIADGKCVPMLVVMNEGLARVPGQTHINDFEGIEGIICEDCRKFIESRYRVKTDKWSRAIAGLSLGSMQACYIGMRHPELFSAIGSFTYIRCRDRAAEYENNPHLDALRDPEQFWTDYRLFFRSIGDAELHMNEFESDDAFIAQFGTDKNPGYVRKTYPLMVHDWNCWRRAVADFLPLLFRW